MLYDLITLWGCTMAEFPLAEKEHLKRQLSTFHLTSALAAIGLGAVVAGSPLFLTTLLYSVSWFVRHHWQRYHRSAWLGYRHFWGSQDAYRIGLV